MITISDEFDDPRGGYANYDAADPINFADLRARQHINIRSFYSDSVVIPLMIYQLVQDMSTIDALTMGDLEGPETTIVSPEPWTGSPGLGPDSALSNFNTMRVSMTGAQTKTMTSVDMAVDLSGWKSTDTISMACPSLPASSLDLSQCSLKLSDGTTTTTLPFPTGLATGSVEISWPYSQLTVFEPTTITLTLVSTATCTVKVAALRLLAAGWTASTMDIDTRLKRLVPARAKNGDPSSNPFTRIWRSADVPGPDDPRPINARLNTTFYTGSKTGANQISIYVRGRREDFLTQLDIDGATDGTNTSKPSVGENQWSLEQAHRQPDFGRAVYNSRPQEDFEGLTQGDLEQTQAELERLPDFISESWIEINLYFGTTEQLVIATTEATQGVYPLSLSLNTQYLLSIDTTDNTLRVKISSLLPEGRINNIIFDTTVIDDFLFKRRKGRVGWLANLASGDAWVDSIRSNGMMFGELITSNFESMTPVEGAQIFSGGTPNVVLSSGLEVYGSAVDLAIDLHNSRSSDGSLKVTADALAGVQSAPIKIEDPKYTEISFDLYYPSSALQFGQPEGFLVNQYGYAVSVLLPAINGNQWQTCKIRLSRIVNEQPGSYRFVLANKTNTTFWIDNFQISRQALSWSGRAVLDDAWNRFNNQWTEFHDLTNDDLVGGVFPERGTWLQVRGQTLTQDAHIDKLYVKPKYAQLGRLIWDVGRIYRG